MAQFGAIAAAIVEEGCTPGQLAAAVTALENAREREREERLERLREGARLRQQRCRERRRIGRHASQRDSAQPPFPLKESSPTPPKENNPLTSGERAPAPASRLPADFEASSEDRAFGAAEGLSQIEIARAIDDLRLWAAEAVGAKALRADWHATLRRFMRRDADAKRAKTGAPPIAKDAGASKTVHVKRDSPQGEAWWRPMRLKTGKSPPLDKAGGWRFPSEWPPAEAQTTERGN